MSQLNSPFKFLDSYQQADADVFFGREKETEALYTALSGVKHLLVYGPSGAGKTSLVECGLRNQFSDADWFALTIRKGPDINASVFASINKALKEKIEIDPVTKMPVDPEIGFGQAIEQLFAERYQPVYLLFDQFEELLISGQEAEKKLFFELLNKLIRNKMPCRIMLIMREEFIGHLSEFEPLCPSIFQHRFRVEKMGRKNVEEVIYHILEAPRYRSFFDVDDSHKLAENILSKLPDKKKEIELAHVQVFLGELWERAQATKGNALPLLNSELIRENDNLEGILESFLKKQMAELEERYGERVPLELLAAMISERFTKLQLSEATINADLAKKKVFNKNPIGELLNELEQRRIIRTLKVGDETQYEISHDVLALVVGQNLTEEMKMREKANDIYEVYLDREGLFTQDDIDYLRPFQQNLVYPPQLQARIDKSIIVLKKESDEQLVKTRKRLRALYSLLGLALLALFVAGIFYFNADKAKKKALVAELKATEALAQTQKIIGAFYFYEDRFALAFKDGKFYFIDRNGDKVEKLDQWDKSEQFSSATGLAKVTGNGTNYLIDTSGYRYRVAYELKDLDDSLKAVDLSEEQLDHIPKILLKNKNLKVLFFNGNNEKILPKEIEGWENMHTLFLSNDGITVLPKEIGKLKSLTHLNLSQNSLTSLPKEIGELKNLTHLNLEINNLGILPKEIWELKKMISLDLHTNGLTRLPTQIGNMKNLTSLILGENQLDSLPKEIGELKKLTSLNLFGIGVTSLPSTIWDLTNLTSLNLSANKLTALPKEVGNLKNLTELDLSYNQITSLPKEIGNLKNLTFLILGGNPLSSLPKEIGALKKLEFLYLDNTNFSQIERDKIQQLLPDCSINYH